MASAAEDLAPIRFDFWSGAPMREVGVQLAEEETHRLPFFQPFKLRRRIEDNQSAILRNYRSTLSAVRNNSAITPAAEWLLDNHHIVEENFRHLRRDLVPSVYRNLSHITLADGTRIPRTLAIIWYFVAVTNSETNLESLTEVIEGFQKIRTLTIGEIWAIPALLRFVLLENLRRLSDRVDTARVRRKQANALADSIHMSNLPNVVSLLEPHTDDCRNATFCSQLLYRLRDGSNVSPKALRWLEDLLRDHGNDPEHMVAAEHAKLSSGNVTVGNIIRSLRTVDDIDWFKWFETVSRVDRVLRRGPDYPQLDKSTRNAYRERIERIARRSEMSEVAVAEAALETAGPEIGAGEVLVGEGQRAFRRACGYRPSIREHLVALYRGLGWLGIFLPAAGLTTLAATLMARAMPSGPFSSLEISLFVLALVPASEAAMGLVNLVGSRLLRPQRLPAYDYSESVPETARTMVVIPCLLTGIDEIDNLVRALELHHLANPRGAISYALLSDWTDSQTESAPDDAELLEHARHGIDALATRYADAGPRRFFLFHRSRLYNARDKFWMGWERKRGKLVELNMLLRGDPDTSFIEVGPRPPDGVRFVVTLDADTRVIRNAIPALVGKMAHPVNRPVINPQSGQVVRGYGILQPRLTPSLTTGAEASLFQRVFSVNRGLDPYVFTVSDLYQDLLGEGSYTGKGIYDIDAFQTATRDRLPENCILSHDLFEGALVRAALVSDVQLVEDFPVDYLVEASRQHRWARGDWQLLPFIFSLSSGLNALGRLKMIDNLRRTMVAPAWVAASVLGWITLSAPLAVQWQLLLVIALFLTPILSVNAGLKLTQSPISQLWQLGVLANESRAHLSAMSLRLAFIAHQAALMADAILRTLYRLFVSRRDLLEWRTASQAEADLVPNTAAYFRAMAASPLIGIAAFLLIAVINPQNIYIAGTFAALWIAAPLVARETSRTLETEDALRLRAEDAAALRETARITWRYFEDFVTAETHDLPPDNFQDLPAPKVAERTSPTNIGLYLLSVLSARDFGWISMYDAVNRVDRTLKTIERLDKFRGHLFNWYDTRNLRVLDPQYVSSVDSGNLAGHLITLSSALKAWAQTPMVHQMPNPDGVGDVLRVARSRFDAIPDDRRKLRPLRRRLQERIEGFESTHETYRREPQLAVVRAIGLSVIADDILRLAQAFDAEMETGETRELVWWINALKANCEALMGDPPVDARQTRDLCARLDGLAERARSIAFSMDFGFLMEPDKRLLSIGYRVQAEQLDSASYDLLASEARLASYFAIAKGDVPNEHWFRLGRPVAARGWAAVLISWSGSMFEYLMPPLVMHERSGGILNQSNGAAVAAHIEHGRRAGLPWGVSECAFNARDREFNYQYHAFGVPSLGLKRMFSDDRVIAPYASALASQFRPREAVANLRRLAALGAAGPHGFFDAVDFTKRRLPEGASHAVVRTVMAHHQGMTIAAIANAVLEGIHRDRFHDDPVVQAAELLLQERAPREIVPITRSAESKDYADTDSDMVPAAQTVVSDPENQPRQLAILSNGEFSAMLTSTGAGYGRIGNRSVTRWRPDPVRDTSGTFFFLRDIASHQWWSATVAPRPAPGEQAEAIFSDHKVEFTKKALGIESHLEIILASEANAQGHRLTLRNRTASERMIEITSYGEIVLDTDAADQAHPAFSKMFIRTSVTRKGRLITARRNKRGTDDRVLHLAHLMCDGSDLAEIESETDRRAFIGRGRDLGSAAAFDPGAALTGATGFTLDPIFALRRCIRLAPGKEAQLTYWTIAADTPDDLDRAVAHYARPETFDHEARLAWTRSQVQLRHLDTSLEDAAVFRDFAVFMLYPDTGLAAQGVDIRDALGPQSNLWRLGLSGDDPIFLLRIDDETDLPIVRKTLRMQEYFHSRGVRADLVILNERASSYIQDLQTAIEALCESTTRTWQDDAGREHIFALRRDQMNDDSWRGLMAAARVALHTRNGKLSEQLARFRTTPGAGPAPSVRTRLLAPPASQQKSDQPRAFPSETLTYWNSYGGFTESGREYVVRLRHGQRTPHPWINVIARPDFGFHVSAGGAGYTWAANSRDYQITPWTNDPVTNRPGEAFYVRDRKTGRIATPFAALSDDPGAIYEARHGLGQSVFRAWTDWAEIEAVQTLASNGPAKLTRLRITNTGSRVLQIDCVAYAELVLGNDPARTAPTIRAVLNEKLRAVLSRNPYSTEFGDRVTALASDREVSAVALSRRAFLGAAGRMSRPAALTGGWSHAALHDLTSGDPCAAISSELVLQPGDTGEINFALANAPEAEIHELLGSVTAPHAHSTALETASAHWANFLGALEVTTPDPRLDLMVNTWLPYQNLACRIRARSAFYQASGAFGFRDQLQDTLALILHDPALARQQILTAASRQFVEGDVQHWWLPGSGAGVRTTISDDVVWLAYATARYIRTTGEAALLDEAVAYLEGPSLEPGHHDAFFSPQSSDLTAPLYEHCARALDLAIERTGSHGLPLILGGDWNDGMNRVGEAGSGESVWLGWFLCAALDDFVPLADARGDLEHVIKWQTHRDTLGRALDKAGWDKAWYRRAYYDDGTPLGSAESDECRIDSIAQSWAAISGAGRPKRAATALDSALTHLLDRDAGILRLFSPPFEKTEKEPGYIKSYPPGVRENGGQYTHAAAWFVYALCRAGRGDEAHALFDMLNPVSHSLDKDAAELYRVEPYVVAADIYGAEDKTGRGGWTWYTGSAGWMHRAAVEGILGIELLHGTKLRVTPVLPAEWPGYTANLRHGGRHYRLQVSRDGTGWRITLDGEPPASDGTFALA